jgi:hypothetical protein
MAAESNRYMIYAIIGSRTFNDYNYLKRCMDPYRENMDFFVSGGAKGADKLGERWAGEYLDRDSIKIYYPDIRAHSSFKAAAHARNRQIAEHADVIFSFWDGKSGGTRHCMNYARSIGKEPKIFRF